jgi:uncharacterized protein YbgA (DUF1722 family)
MQCKARENELYSSTSEAVGKDEGELAEFHIVYSHCMVPYNYEENRTLGRWLSKQRTGFRQDMMGTERRDRLDRLRCTWTMQGIPRR